LLSRPFSDELEAGGMALRRFLPLPFRSFFLLCFCVGICFNNSPQLPLQCKNSPLPQPKLLPETGTEGGLGQGEIISQGKEGVYIFFKEK